MLDDTEKHLFWDDIEGTLKHSVFRLEKAGQNSLSAKVPEEHADHLKGIGIAVERLRQSYDELAWLLEPLRENHPNELKSVYQMIFVLMESAMLIGTSVVWSDVTKDIFKRATGRDQAAIALAANIKNAKDRKVPLREAINHVCDKDGVEPKATRKFADSIRPEVLKKMDLSAKTRGFSSKTIQTELRTILEERRESLTHS